MGRGRFPRPFFLFDEPAEKLAGALDPSLPGLLYPKEYQRQDEEPDADKRKHPRQKEQPREKSD